MAKSINIDVFTVEARSKKSKGGCRTCRYVGQVHRVACSSSDFTGSAKSSAMRKSPHASDACLPDADVMAMPL